jgi:hypothetical protein
MNYKPLWLLLNLTTLVWNFLWEGEALFGDKAINILAKGVIREIGVQNEWMSRFNVQCQD